MADNLEEAPARGLAAFAPSSSASLAPAAAAPPGEKESFTATVLPTANTRMPPGRTYRIAMNVERSTPLEERQRIATLLKDSGEDAVLEQRDEARLDDPPG